jgi:hypothetical protein
MAEQLEALQPFDVLGKLPHPQANRALGPAPQQIHHRSPQAHKPRLSVVLSNTESALTQLAVAKPSGACF